MEQNETRTLWISIGSAIFAVILLYGWAQDKRANFARKFGQTKTVVIATKDIREFEIMDESMLEVVEKPADFLQPGAYQDPVDLVGQIALAPFQKGEQILKTKTVFPDKSTGLSMQVSPGKRAVTIPSDMVQSNAQLIKPGDRVDVIVPLDDGKGRDKIRKMVTLLQDVPVLATGQAIVDNLALQIQQGDQDDLQIRNMRVQNDYNTITLEVLPSEAPKLYYLVADDRRIFTALRNPNDRLASKIPTTDINRVLNRGRQKASAPKLPRTKPNLSKKPAKAPARPPSRPKTGGGYKRL